MAQRSFDETKDKLRRERAAQDANESNIDDGAPPAADLDVDPHSQLRAELNTLGGTILAVRAAKAGAPEQFIASIVEDAGEDQEELKKSLVDLILSLQDKPEAALAAVPLSRVDDILEVLEPGTEATMSQLVELIALLQSQRVDLRRPDGTPDLTESHLCERLCPHLAAPLCCAHRAHRPRLTIVHHVRRRAWRNQRRGRVPSTTRRHRRSRRQTLWGIPGQGACAWPGLVKSERHWRRPSRGIPNRIDSFCRGKHASNSGGVHS